MSYGIPQPLGTAKRKNRVTLSYVPVGRKWQWRKLGVFDFEECEVFLLCNTDNPRRDGVDSRREGSAERTIGVERWQNNFNALRSVDYVGIRHNISILVDDES